MKKLIYWFKSDFLICLFLGLILLTPSSYAAERDYLYLTLEGGVSLPVKLRFSPGPPWDPSVSGYNNRMSNSEVLGVGLGYHFCPWLSAEVMLDHRNSFKYNKFQISPAALGDKSRIFNIRNTTVMANFIAHGRGISECLVYENANYCIDPFVNVGLGVAYNTVDNFHSVSSAGGSVFSMMTPYTKTNFAYQCGLGLQMTFCDNMSICFGYRYLATGRFRSNDYLIDNSDVPGATGGVQAPAWTGRFDTNELYCKFVFAI